MIALSPENSGTRRCAWCKYKLHPNQEICPYCGHLNHIPRSAVDREAKQALKSTMPNTITVYCLYCGTNNSIIADGQDCIACGKSLGPALESISKIKKLDKPSSSISRSAEPPSRPRSSVPIKRPVETRDVHQPKKTEDQSIFDYKTCFDGVMLSASFIKDSHVFFSGTSANSIMRVDVSSITIDDRLDLSFPENGLNVLRTNGGQIVFCMRGDVMKWANIHVIDLETRKIVKTISSPQSAILAVAMSPNGDKLIAGGYDKLVELWDMESGNLVYSMKGHEGPIDAVVLVPNMQVAVSGSRDKMLKIWNINTGDLIRTLEGHKGPVISIAVSPDGSRIASGSDDHAIRIWDMNDGKLVHVLNGHKAPVTVLLVSSDGHHLISGSRDMTVKVWNIDKGGLLKTIEGHVGTVKTLALSPDEACLVTGAADRTAMYWPFKDYMKIKKVEEQVVDVT